MKKLLSLCLALMLVGCSAAPTASSSGLPASSSSSPSSVSSVPPSSSSAPSSVSSSAPSESSQGNIGDLDGFAVEKGADTATIVFPESLAKGIMGADFNIDEYIKKNGFVDATLESDGSLRVIITKSQHSQMVKEMEQSIDATFDKIKNNPNSAYIKKIVANDNYSDITIFVDKAGYESAFDMTPLNISLNVGFYYVLIDKEPNLTIHIVDDTTKEEFKTITLPEEKS